MTRRRSKKFFTMEFKDSDYISYVAVRLEAFKRTFPDASEKELKVREVLGRFKGEAGLKESQVHYLTACIINSLYGVTDIYHREMGETFYDALR